MFCSTSSKVIVSLVTLFLLTGSSVQARTVVREDFYSQRPRSQATTLADSIATPPIDWPLGYGVQQTGFLNASFSDRGTFGRSFSDQSPIAGWPDASFESPPGSGKEYLWGGSIWVGGIVGGDTLVSIGADGWQFNVRELYPPNYPNEPGVSLLEGFADFSMRAVTVDSFTIGVAPSHNPLNIQLANRSHVWHDEDNNRSIIYDLTITNVGEQLIEAGYVGFYFDGDVGVSTVSGFYTDDFAGSIKGEGIGYMIDNDGDPTGMEFSDSIGVTRALAFKFLSTSFEATVRSFHWWISNGNAALDYSPRLHEHDRLFCAGNLGTPVCDADKYYLMSNPEWDYDQILTASISPIDPDWQYPNQFLAADLSNGFDTRMFMSLGPFDLRPDSSVRIQYTTFTADSIHTDPANFGDNVGRNYHPYSYIDNLQLEGLILTASKAQAKATELLNPLLPPTGLTLMERNEESISLAWDPWVYDDIEGYDLFLTRIDPTSFPHPGIIPPWINSSDPILVAELGLGREHTLTNYDYKSPYLAHLAHRTAGGSGSLSRPAVIVPYLDRMPSPTVAQPIGIVTMGELMTLEWTEPEGVTVDHYNIYRFSDRLYASGAYSPFYSRSDRALGKVPVDTIDIEGELYYFYRMEPDFVVDGSLQSVEVTAVNREIYIITAVDAFGFESDMTTQIEIMEISPKSKDLLVITGSTVNFTMPSVIESFYSRVLCGTELDYDISVIYLDCGSDRNCPSLMKLSRYDLVIIDDNTYNIGGPAWWDALGWYVATGGKLATFSYQDLIYAPRSPNLIWQMTTLPGEADHQLGDYFSIDSALCVTPAYFIYNGGVPETDTIFSLHRAVSQSPSVTSLTCDTARYPLPGTWSFFWPVNSPPEVTIFVPGKNAFVTHTLSSLYPESSIFEGAAIGLQTITLDDFGLHTTYAFGFHLYHMKISEARALVGHLLGRTFDCCGTFTSGFTGNVDFDLLGKRNLSDITRLIDRVYGSKERLCCEENGNIDGDIDSKINIADITRLIDHSYLSKEETAGCEL